VHNNRTNFHDRYGKFKLFISFSCRQSIIKFLFFDMPQNRVKQMGGKLKMILRKSLGFQYVNALSCVWVLYVFLGCLKIEHFVFFLFNAFGRLPFACGCCCWLCRSGHSTCKSSACISHVFAVFVNIRNSNYCCGGDVETAERARNTQQQ